MRMIIEKARELGIALSESEEFLRMNRARAAMEADATLMSALDEYNQKQNDIMELMSGDADVSEIQGMSADLERLHDMLTSSELFTAMLEAQNGFQALMKRVNRAIGLCVGMEIEEDGDSACGSDCAHCAGCKH